MQDWQIAELRFERKKSNKWRIVTRPFGHSGMGESVDSSSEHKFDNYSTIFFSFHQNGTARGDEAHFCKPRGEIERALTGLSLGKLLAQATLLFAHRKESERRPMVGNTKIILLSLFVGDGNFFALKREIKENTYVTYCIHKRGQTTLSPVGKDEKSSLGNES